MRMDVLFIILRVLHIIGGFVALFVFWIPLVTKKGGKIHKQIGWIFVWAMGIVSISALYMGVYRVLFDVHADAERISFSLFLIFIAVLSGATAWYGLRVLRFKLRKAIHWHFIDLFVSLLLFLSGLAIGLYGFVIKSPLISYFPLLGLFLGVIQLIYWLRKPMERMHWLYEHLSGMIACSISTVTAFTVFGAPRLMGIQTNHLFLWLMPTMILVPFIIGYQLYYKK